MKIYLAGKITGDDWRYAIVPSLRDAQPQVDVSLDPRGHIGTVAFGFPVLPRAVFGVHDYVGPFFVQCGHTCFFGNDSHGVGAWDVQREGDYDTDHGCPLFAACDGRSEPEGRFDVTRVCLGAVDRADLVFGWLENETCHGTLVEIGYALAKGKQVFVASPNPPHDLWFAWYAADKTLGGHGLDPATALRRLLAIDTETLRTMPYKEYLQTDHWKQKRAEALEAAGHRCQLCYAATSLQVHHRTYERRGAELPSDLIALCAICHRGFHARIGLVNGRVR